MSFQMLEFVICIWVSKKYNHTREKKNINTAHKVYFT